MLIYVAHDSGQVLETVVDSPTFTAKHERFFCGIVDVEKAKDETLPTLEHFDDIQSLDALASLSKDGRTLRLSIVQKLETQPLTLRLDLHGLTPAGTSMTLHRLTRDGDVWVENTLDHPHRVGMQTEELPLTTSLTIPPASLSVFEIKLQ